MLFKKSKKWTFLLVAYFVCAGVLASAETKSGQEKEARRFVQSFYDRYLKASGDPLPAALRSQKSAFTPELLNLLQADLSASQKSQEEVVGLDFDPFLAGNDPGDIYKVNEVQVKAGTYWVQVLGFYKGQTSPCCEATVEVVFSKEKLVISNVHYPDAGSIPANENLVSMLKSLAKERSH